MIVHADHRRMVAGWGRGQVRRNGGVGGRVVAGQWLDLACGTRAAADKTGEGGWAETRAHAGMLLG